MRPLTQAQCDIALRACEERLELAISRNPSDVPRLRMEMELIRKAWQVVLCTMWEAKYRQEHPEAEQSLPSSAPYARSARAS